MADPVALAGRPDVEALVWREIRDIAPRAITSWSFAAVPLPAPHGWYIASSVQIDVRASSKKAAYDRAMLVRTRLLSLPDAEWREGVVSAVYIVLDFSWFPVEDGGPRYTARFEVRAHPRSAHPRKEALV